MSDVSVVMIAVTAVIIVVTLCVTLRPGASKGVTTALYALAAVFAAIWPWSRKP